MARAKEGGAGAPADWTEIHSWSAARGSSTGTGYDPEDPQDVENLKYQNISTFGEESGSLGSNKTIHIYRKALLHPEYPGETFTGRLYNVTKAVTIATISAPGADSKYSQVEGSPLVNYSYLANDVVCAQTIHAVFNTITSVLFEGRVF